MADRQKQAKQKPNDPCRCGSGKKFKKCCALAEAIATANRKAASAHNANANSLESLLDRGLRFSSGVNATNFASELTEASLSDVFLEEDFEGSPVIFMGWPFKFTSAEVCSRLREQQNFVVVDVSSWSKELILEAFRSCNPRETYYMQMSRENFKTFIDVQLAGPVSYTHLTLPTICSV